MPMFNYKCPKCGFLMHKLMSIEDCPRKDGLHCPKDHTELVRDYSTGPSTQTKEILDNGLMPKAVERYTDAEKIYDDNSHMEKD